MREAGTVVGVAGRLARVRMEGGSQCDGCCACSLGSSGQRELEVATDIPVQAGSRVIVEIGSASAWLSTFLLFVLPLLGLVGGVIAGEQWRPLGVGGNAEPLVLGFGLLAVFFALAAIIDRLFVRPRQPDPTIVDVLTPGAKEPQ
jgi:sigma-E factor negative regulatory protein RseC